MREGRGRRRSRKEGNKIGRRDKKIKDDKGYARRVEEEEGEGRKEEEED